MPGRGPDWPELGHVAAAGDDRQHDVLAERELQGSRRQRHAVRRSHLLDPRGPLHQLRRRLGVEEGGAGLGAGRQDAGIEGCRQHDADPPLAAERQEPVVCRVVEQRVAAGQHEEVEITRLGEADAPLGVVDADAEGANGAALAQLQKRLVATLHHRPEALLDGVPGPARRDVVDVEDVDPLDPEPAERVLEAAHDAVIAVVEDRRERQRRPRLVTPRPQQSADLGGQDEGVARPADQRLAHAVLGEPGAIERRHVEIAHPTGQRGVDQVHGLAGIAKCGPAGPAACRRSRRC